MKLDLTGLLLGFSAFAGGCAVGESAMTDLGLLSCVCKNPDFRMML